MTYWSGVWATALLLLALAITPALTITQWGQLIIVRRMIGVAALAAPALAQEALQPEMLQEARQWESSLKDWLAMKKGTPRDASNK